MCPRDSENDFVSFEGEPDTCARLRELAAPDADLLVFDYDDNLIFDREALGMWLLRSAEALEWRRPAALPR